MVKIPKIPTLKQYVCFETLLTMTFFVSKDAFGLLILTFYFSVYPILYKNTISRAQVFAYVVDRESATEPESRKSLSISKNQSHTLSKELIEFKWMASITE